jgi:hypothetical protein
LLETFFAKLSKSIPSMPSEYSASHKLKKLVLYKKLSSVLEGAKSWLMLMKELMLENL